MGHVTRSIENIAAKIGVEETLKLTIVEGERKFGWYRKTSLNMLRCGERFCERLPPRKQGPVEPVKPKLPDNHDKNVYDAYWAEYEKWQKEQHLWTVENKAWEDDGKWKTRDTEDQIFIEIVTLGEVCKGLEELHRNTQTHEKQLSHVTYPTPYVKEYLKKIGLTKLECVALSGEVSSGQLSTLPHEKLLSLDAEVLGTLSAQALALSRKYLVDERTGEKMKVDASRYDRHDYGIVEQRPRITVRDLLAMKPGELRGKGVGRTTILLRSLGFTEVDGPFLEKESDPIEQLTEELVIQEDMSRDDARRFAMIAAKHDWI